MNKKLIYPLIISACLSGTCQAAMLAVEAGMMDWQSKASGYFGEAKDNNPFITLKGAVANDYGDIYGQVKWEDPDDGAYYGTEINVIGQINLGRQIGTSMVRYLTRVNPVGEKPTPCWD